MFCGIFIDLDLSIRVNFEHGFKNNGIGGIGKCGGAGGKNH